MLLICSGFWLVEKSVLWLLFCIRCLVCCAVDCSANSKTILIVFIGRILAKISDCRVFLAGISCFVLPCSLAF